MFDDLFPSTHGHEGMTLVEVGEVIRRTGRQQGFEVVAEYPIRVGDSTKKVDWVWRDAKGKVVRAFEVEGRDAPPRSLAGDLIKFQALRAQQAKPAIRCAVVAYTVRFQRNEGWNQLPDGLAGMRDQLRGQRVDCVADGELIAHLTA